MSDALESRLGQLRPRAFSRSLEDRIATELDRKPASARGNRFFWSAVASGAMAASVIVAVLATQPTRRANAAPAFIGRSNPNPLTALARADRRWGDELKLASDWSQP
ncbi:MAG TPA: hypothetical protein VK797_14420 [Tepidisphaeraceae bacterium]|jgi:hypothetical protein|nr:hypothetical protein [Tepidisphaeraceae bacterium]